MADANPIVQALRQTPIRSHKRLGNDETGVNSTYRVQLEDDTKAYLKPDALSDTHGQILHPDAVERRLSKPPADTSNSRHEAASYHLDLALGLGMVPETTVRQDPYWGSSSLQKEHPPDKPHPTPQQVPTTQPSLPAEQADRAAFQKMRMFDIISGNNDRHIGNWLRRHNEQGELVPAPIDHGTAFPEGTRVLGLGSVPEDHNTSLPGPVEPEVLAILENIDYEHIAGTLFKSNVKPDAILGVLCRIEILKDKPSIIEYPKMDTAQYIRKTNAWNKKRGPANPELVKVVQSFYPDWQYDYKARRENPYPVGPYSKPDKQKQPTPQIYNEKGRVPTNQIKTPRR